jgi:hypothetical protein
MKKWILLLNGLRCFMVRTITPYGCDQWIDLVVVAVLTVFGLTHDLSRPGAIPIFLGYVLALELLLMG